MKHVKRSPAFPLEPNKSDYCLVGEKKKRKYKTQLDAVLSAPAKELQQYICDYCGYWHNGSSSKDSFNK
jgi:rubrerythrin